MPATKLYIFTIPKAGSYFLAELMSRLGWENSGLHVAEDHVLDVKQTDLTDAARDPHSTTRWQSFYQSLESVQDGGLCFGHMNPMHFYGPHPSEFAVVGCRRQLRKVLVAEFIDFRFRRQDHLVQWVSRDTIADDRQAFAEYMDRHGPIIAHIAATYIAYRDLRSAAYYTRAAKLGAYVDLSFEALMGPYPQPELRKLAWTLSLHKSDAELMDILQQAKTADNKTKSVDEALPIDRNTIWDNAQALATYERLGLEELSVRLGYPQ